MRRRTIISLLAAFTATALSFTPLRAAAPLPLPQAAQTQKLPTELTDSAFWNIISTFSEPEQQFGLYMVSNEQFFPMLVQSLLALNARGGAYIGVAPEQNYHYIAAIRPQIAFIMDIRRQAVIQHLMFKAIFELSADRADFISLLFTKPRPSGIAANATAYQTWNAFWYISTDTSRYRANINRVFDQLTKKHKFPLSTVDSSLVRFTFDAFYTSGPSIVSSGGAGAEGATGTFANITSAVDAGGMERSFLANEEAYQAVRQMHLKNLIIPVVGDFAGVKALRAIGNYLRERNTTVTAFYISNVEDYLGRGGGTPGFAANVGMLPINERSVLIRGVRPGSLCNIQSYLAYLC